VTTERAALPRATASELSALILFDARQDPEKRQQRSPV
jgi:hypothetical protein